MPREYIKYIFGVLGVLLIGCNNNSPTESKPATVLFSHTSNWRVTEPPNNDVQLIPNSNGFKFDIPNTGSINYIVGDYIGPVPHNYANLVLRTNADPSIVIYPFGSDQPPATVSIMLQRCGDKMVSGFEYYRWWAGRTELQRTVQNTISISVPLVYTQWSDVNGQQDSTKFEDTLNNLCHVGITFGGRNFAGHGIIVHNGTAVVEVLDFEVN